MRVTTIRSLSFHHPFSLEFTIGSMDLKVLLSALYVVPLLIVPSQALNPVAAVVLAATPDKTDGGSEGLSLGKGRLEREEESFSIETSLGLEDD